MNNKKKCFVIMPFSKTFKLNKGKWTEIFEHIIKPAVEESGFGYKCERYEFRRANITKDILQELNSAHMVIADLTGSNPNVLWELGIRHTIKRRTLLISQATKFIPSDLKDYPVIPYDQSKAGFDKFKDDIKSKLEDIEADPDKPDSPVADFLQLKNIDILAYEKAANVKKLSALISELSGNLSLVDFIYEKAKKNQSLREGKKSGISITNRRFETTCLEVLLSTYYIIVPDNLLRNAKEAYNNSIGQNQRLALWQNKTYENSVEKNFIAFLPHLKNRLVRLLGQVNKLRLDYMNDNYQEPGMPSVILSSPEHEKYLEITK